jgi:hypothetical protein
VVSQCVRGAQAIERKDSESAGLLSRAAASNSCRKNIGLSTLSSDSTLYRKVAERQGDSSILHKCYLTVHNLNEYLPLEMF